MKRLRRFLLFAHTLTTSAINEWRITGRIRWRVAPKILMALWPRQQPDRRPGSAWWLRMRGCQPCPLYDANRRACGRIGETFEAGGLGGFIEPLGCGCFLPLKAGDPDATCYLFARTNGDLGEDWAKMLERAQKRSQCLKPSSCGEKSGAPDCSTRNISLAERQTEG